MDEPISIPTARHILFCDFDGSEVLLLAWTNGRDTSAAFPTIGSAINPMNVVATPDDLTIASMLTRNPAHTATTPVNARRNRIAT